MDTGRFDMFHDAGDDHPLPIADRIHVNFDRIFQEAVDEYGLALRGQESLLHETFELVLVVTDFHSPAAQNKTGPNQHGKSQSGRFLPGLRDAPGNTTRRLLKPNPL